MFLETEFGMELLVITLVSGDPFTLEKVGIATSRYQIVSFEFIG